MKIQDAFKNNYETAVMVCGVYLSDLTDDESMQRPHSGCNHINWQVGHIIESENGMANSCVAGAVPPLPNGFAEKYSKETAACDDPSAFVPHSELLLIAKNQGDAILAMIDTMSAEDFDMPAPEAMQSYAPTIGAVVNMMASHWMMHAGQWVVVRRQLGREIVI
jgi:hypothetical protein